MKTLTQLTLAVTLAATATASSHHHGHRHMHAKKDASKVEKREPDAVTVISAAATTVVYQLGDKLVDESEAKKGIADGEYVIVGESTPTYTPPPAPSTTKDLGAQFIDSTAEAAVANAAAISDDSSSSGDDREFPNGKIKCSHFPSDYGAVPIPWMGLGGWSFTQTIPGGLGGVVDNIITGIAGDTCKPGAYCGYACKPGYQKSQWPQDAQGSKGQTIGGVLCNDNGYLELTRSEYKTLCIPGEPGVFIQNDLDVVVSTCQTQYPGTEGMTIPTIAQPGQKVPVTNPNQETYFKWQGKKTSNQYYINPKGVGAKDACCWKSELCPDKCGNWSPMNLGVGKDNGVTYISIFQNAPTSTAWLDFNVEIIGGNTECKYENGAYTPAGTGCTTGVADGQTAIIRYY
ncbi:hypothetical protein NLG97_g409 [Lecanicillium saksenae]|uniref:Uncharacterized protein n=1 Tax=Lecanicillium saksenae TaxID=468837 RepID=A0ACC1R7X7_9HYPO|nr:hypothetical protein NLG97_g409 [Lecanicillium saksenae]